MPQSLSRRLFVSSVTALAAGVASSVAGLHRMFRVDASADEQVLSGPEPDVSLDAKPAVLPETYPHWTYMTPGFVLTSTWRDYPGGFMSKGQIVQYFQRPGQYARQHQMAFLSIYIAPATTKRPIEAVDRAPEVVQVTGPDGKARNVDYYDGVWQPTKAIDPPADRTRVANGETLLWNTQNFHSAVFSLPSFSVLLHGCRYGDIDRDELLKIAASFTV
jgi:hypothetical protein